MLSEVASERDQILTDIRYGVPMNDFGWFLRIAESEARADSLAQLRSIEAVVVPVCM
jgi:hypothetical protein